MLARLCACLASLCFTLCVRAVTGAAFVRLACTEFRVRAQLLWTAAAFALGVAVSLLLAARACVRACGLRLVCAVLDAPCVRVGVWARSVCTRAVCAVRALCVSCVFAVLLCGVCIARIVASARDAAA